MIPGSYTEECSFDDLPLVEEKFYTFGGDDVWLHSYDDAMELMRYLNAKRFLHQSFPAGGRKQRTYEQSTSWCVRYVRPKREEYPCVVALCSRPGSVQKPWPYYLKVFEGANTHIFPPGDGLPFYGGDDELFNASVQSYSSYPCKLFTRVEYPAFTSYYGEVPKLVEKVTLNSAGVTTGRVYGLLANGICKRSATGKTIRKSNP